MKYSTSISREDRGFDLEALPDTQTIRASHGSGVGMIVFGLIFCAFVTMVAIGIARETPLGWWVLVGNLIAAYVVFRGVSLLASSTKISLSKSSVDVVEKSLFGENDWHEKIESYRGLLYDIEIRSTGSGNSRHSYKVFTLKLLHPDPARTVKIFESLKEQGFRQRWENAARFFRLPALEKQNGKILERQTEDLDKNISELIAESKLVINEDALRNPPKGIDIRQAGKETVMTYKMKIRLLSYLIVLLFPAVFIYLGFFVKRVPVMFSYAGLFFAFIVILLPILTLITMIKVIIDEENVILENIVFGATLLHEKVPLKEIEQVSIGQLENEASKGVVLASDSTKLQVGTGLPEPALQWLEALILKAASEQKSAGISSPES